MEKKDMLTVPCGVPAILYEGALGGYQFGCPRHCIDAFYCPNLIAGYGATEEAAIKDFSITMNERKEAI